MSYTTIKEILGIIVLIILMAYEYYYEVYLRPEIRQRYWNKQDKITEQARKMQPSLKRFMLLHRKAIKLIGILIILFVFFQINDHFVDGHFVW